MSYAKPKYPHNTRVQHMYNFAGFCPFLEETGLHGYLASRRAGRVKDI